MTWSPDTAFVEGLDVFGGVVTRYGPTDWERPSPCAGWRALDVLGHVGAAVGFGTALLTGGAPAWAPLDPPGDAVEGDPQGWWRARSAPARAAVAGVDLDRMVDGPTGRRSVGEGLSFPALDLFVHAWDLARSLGGGVEIPAEARAFAERVLGAVPDETIRSPRVFAPAAAAPPGASPTEELIAWTGRDPRWSPG